MHQSEWINKAAQEWVIEDIEGLAEAEEGAYLEFKKPLEFMVQGKFSKDVLSSELAETVSAFLNSDGGVLLVGVQTTPDPGDKKAEALKPILAWSTDQTFENLGVTLTASRILDIIYGNIMPKPLGIGIKALHVPLGGSTVAIFVITVPVSNLGAHQSIKTARYYRRMSDGDVPMLDYEIRDVNNRKSGPVLLLECAVANDGAIFEDDEWKSSQIYTRQVADEKGDSFSQVDVVFAITNFGRGTANIAKFDIGVPNPWEIYRYSPEGTDVGVRWVSNNASRYLTGSRATIFWRPEKCPEIPPHLRAKKIDDQSVNWESVVFNGYEPPTHPLWPEADRVVVGVLGLQIQISVAVSTESWVPWRIRAEGMPEMRGAFLFKGISGLFRVVNYAPDDVSWWGMVESMDKFNALKEKFQV